jgi:hypothetical protein
MAVEPSTIAGRMEQMSLASRAIHADDHLSRTQDVAPPLHVSTTFCYPRKASDLVPESEIEDVFIFR